MIEVIILAIALSMDAFAVSLTLGARKQTEINKVALLAGLYFGVFQGLMPLIGYFGGAVMLAWLGGITIWIAFLLLAFIGLKMIYEGLGTQPEVDDTSQNLSHSAFLLLAIATSIDALAAGFSLTLLDFNSLLACLIIAVITFLFSYLGVRIGGKSLHWIGSKAEVFGGIILVILGLKILLT